MTGPIDRTRPVRTGEELPHDALAAWLTEHVADFAGPLEIEQFPGGHSNLTYLLRGGDREWVLRRPPRGLDIRTAHDMGREYRVLSHLVGHYDRIPRPVAFCEQDSPLGAPFYVMERVRGIVLRSATPPAGLDLGPDVMRRLSMAVADNLAAIHAVDLDATGLRDFGRPQGYLRRQVEGWTRRYADARTDDVPDVELAARWLAERMPAGDREATLIHNDYKYDNVILDGTDPTRILAVLDWEMSTIGDPLLDIGTALSLWMDADDPDMVRALPFGPTALPGNLDRRGLLERYAATSGRSVGTGVYEFVYGAFKMAVILQQIYKRYKLGFSRDERFAAMIVGVHVFGLMARLAIERGRIDRLG